MNLYDHKYDPRRQRLLLHNETTKQPVNNFEPQKP